MGSALSSSSSREVVRTDLVKHRVLGMMDPLAVSAVTEALGSEVVEAERLTGSVVLGLFHLMVGPEYAEEALANWTCRVEHGVLPRIVLERPAPRSARDDDGLAVELRHMLVRWGGVEWYLSDNRFFFQGEDRAESPRREFLFYRVQPPFQSMLMYKLEGEDEINDRIMFTEPVHGDTLDEVMTESLPRAYDPATHVFAFIGVVRNTYPDMYAGPRASVRAAAQYVYDGLVADMVRMQMTGRIAESIELRGLNDARSLFEAKCAGGARTADELEDFRRETLRETFGDAAEDVLSTRVFFGTYAHAMRYVQRTWHPSFEVVIREI